MIPTDFLNYGLGGLGLLAIIYIVRDFLGSRKDKDRLFAEAIITKDQLFTKTINNHFQHEMVAWTDNAKSQQRLADSIDGLAEIVKDKLK